MDPLVQHHYNARFEAEFLKARGDNFQLLLGRIMSLAYPGDFVQTRPWGNLGDEKCDGYLRSARKFFQCYAPNEFEKSVTLKKVHDDFAGALPHALGFFNAWVFAHNAQGGRLPTWLVREIEQLEVSQPNITIEVFGYEELGKVVHTLSSTDLVSLFGPPITQQALLSLGFAELRPILTYLAAQSVPEDDDPHPVSPQKLTYNALGADIEALLKAGMTKAKLVNDYLARMINKEQGMRIATRFRHEYQTLKAANLPSVEIFDRLREFAHGPGLPDGKTEVGTLAIMAYLFEECDIFENPEDRST